MISYYDGQLTDIMPWNIIRNPEVKAISYALQQGCRILYKVKETDELLKRFYINIAGGFIFMPIWKNSRKK